MDKEDSCGEMSVPSSPQNEAIQHSSISTSNGRRSRPAPLSGPPQTTAQKRKTTRT
ncbi:hypothetical protein M9458_019347, partial [Cirrhinus mrigala]